MPGVKQQCQVCGGESFTTSHGLKVCDQCGRQEDHYVELLSQETIGEVDRSRLLTTRLPEDEAEDAAHLPQPCDQVLNNWTTYEAYNSVLYEWTKALLKLGASPKVESITFKLWVAYLQRIGVAFSKERKSFSSSSLQNSRDKQILYEKAESVSSKSLFSYTRRRKKKAARTKLDKIRDKIELKKMRNALKKKHDSSFMNTTLASELSKSLNEFEASMMSDSMTSYTPSQDGGSPALNVSGRSDLSSVLDVSSSNFHTALDAETTTQADAALILPRKLIRRDKVVLNWIKHSSHIYGTEDQQEEIDEDHDSDGYSSKVSTKKDSDQQSLARKAEKKGKVKKPKPSKTYKKSGQPSSELHSYNASRLPFLPSFSRLLAILYLAVLLAQDDILLSDILRWCREGHIPYFSAPYLLKADMEVTYYDLFMMRNSKKLPDASEVQDIAGRLAVFLNLQYVPLPPPPDIVNRYVKLLNLPERVAVVAENLLKLPGRTRQGLTIPPIESMAMASIILVLKLYCGLDDHTEVLLSHAGDAITAKMPTKSSIIPFSWLDWQRHMSQVVWVCCQVDPSTALHWQPLSDVRYFSPSLFSAFFWNEDMWRVPRTSCKKKAELQVLTEELLQHQGVSLEEVIMQPSLFQASKRPLSSTLEQLIHRDCAATQTKEMMKYVKIAEEMTDKSFTKHSLSWFCEGDLFATELHKSGLKMKLQQTESKEKSGICKIQIYDDNHTTLGKKKTRNLTQELFIPQPLKNLWDINGNHKTWEKISPLMPISYKWLVNLASHICETSKMQLQSHVTLLQTKMKERKYFLS